MPRDALKIIAALIIAALVIFNAGVLAGVWLKTWILEQWTRDESNFIRRTERQFLPSERESVMAKYSKQECEAIARSFCDIFEYYATNPDTPSNLEELQLQLPKDYVDLDPWIQAELKRRGLHFSVMKTQQQE